MLDAEYLRMLADKVSMCKVDHKAVKLDEAAWSALDYVGVQDPDTEWALELRNCTCGSTLCRKIQPNALAHSVTSTV